MFPACAINSYKTGTNAARSCTPCPENTHTEVTASTLSAQCICNLGYERSNGAECTGDFINKILLINILNTKDKYTGSIKIIIMSVHILSALISHTIRSIFFAVIQCPALTAPTNGRIGSCTRTYQGTCAIHCIDGHIRRSGVETRICLVSKRWSGTNPTCHGNIFTHILKKASQSYYGVSDKCKQNLKINMSELKSK